MQARRRQLARLAALVLGLALAIAATAALVLTDDPQTLQLAVLGALWAFLIAAFFVARQGHGSGSGGSAGLGSSDPAAAPGTSVELAQRREIELLTEVRLRREIEGGLRAELGAVREDLARLRHDILERWDGELRVERIAVRAESTRFSGLGSTFAALQDEARRLQDDDRSFREVTAGPRVLDQRADRAAEESEPVHPAPSPAVASPPVDEPGPAPFDSASTIEFTVIPPTMPAPPAPAVPAAPTPGQWAPSREPPLTPVAEPPPAPAPPAGEARTADIPLPGRSADDTGPVFGDRPVIRRPSVDDFETTVLPRIRPDEPPATGPARPPEQLPAAEGRRQRSRHEADGREGVDAGALLRRLQAEPTSAGSPRRRRARDDDETNDVLARLIGDQAG